MSIANDRLFTALKKAEESGIDTKIGNVKVFAMNGGPIYVHLYGQTIFFMIPSKRDIRWVADDCGEQTMLTKEKINVCLSFVSAPFRVVIHEGKFCAVKDGKHYLLPHRFNNDQADAFRFELV